MSHFMFDGGDGAGSLRTAGAVGELFSDSGVAFGGFAFAVVAGRVEIEIDIVRLIGKGLIGDELNLSGKDLVEVADGRVDVGDVAGILIDDVGDLIHAADLRPFAPASWA